MYVLYMTNKCLYIVWASAPLVLSNSLISESNEVHICNVQERLYWLRTEKMPGFVSPLSTVIMTMQHHNVTSVSGGDKSTWGQETYIGISRICIASSCTLINIMFVLATHIPAIEQHAWLHDNYSISESKISHNSIQLYSKFKYNKIHRLFINI